MVLKRVGALSVGKVAGLLYGILGLCIGLVVMVFTTLGFALGAAASGSDNPFLGIVFGAGAIFLFPIFYGVMGFVFGVISALLYNVIAGFVGGIELDIQ